MLYNFNILYSYKYKYAYILFFILLFLIKIIFIYVNLLRAGICFFNFCMIVYVISSFSIPFFLARHLDFLFFSITNKNSATILIHVPLCIGVRAFLACPEEELIGYIPPKCLVNVCCVPGVREHTLFAISISIL